METFYFTNLELRYLASCLLRPELPNYEKKREVREELRRIVVMGSGYELRMEELKEYFPKIAQLIQKGFFRNRTVQQYFEGTDLESHNMRLYLFSKRYKNNEWALKSIESCLVRPVHLPSRIVTSLSGDLETRIDHGYFNVKGGEFGFTHGYSDYGLILVRTVSEEEYHQMVKFFRETQASRRNPYRKF